MGGGLLHCWASSFQHFNIDLHVEGALLASADFGLERPFRNWFWARCGDGKSAVPSGPSFRSSSSHMCVILGLPGTSGPSIPAPFSSLHNISLFASLIVYIIHSTRRGPISWASFASRGKSCVGVWQSLRGSFLEEFFAFKSVNSVAPKGLLHFWASRGLISVVVQLHLGSLGPTLETPFGLWIWLFTSPGSSQGSTYVGSPHVRVALCTCPRFCIFMCGGTSVRICVDSNTKSCF